MAARRARLGIGHALAWIAYGLVAAAVMTDAVARDSAALTLALGATCAVAAAAIGLLAPVRIAPRALLIAAAGVAAAAAAVAGALALLDQPPHPAIAAALGLAAGVHTAAIRDAVVADHLLGLWVRPAPTLLAAAAGVALVATIVAVPGSSLLPAIALVVAAGLQLVALGLVVASGRAPADPVGSSASALPESADREAAPSAAMAPPPLLALLAIAAAGAVAIVALRPGLSAIGTDEPQPAGPLALTLALGALLGPPLAVLAGRSGGSAATVLATVGGGAALIAPIARPGVLDLVAAAVLGVALAASIALAELARRSGVRLARGATALIVLAGAAGAGVAALLLAAVPLPDVVLCAALACLVAGVGVWAPGMAARQPVG
ncbi:hypothetical protein [Agrococcus sp. ARC_14]|uniref:hypothetical protein n=1 Tax=Agrococcus sp. ARC_14 TaxID=2919927 RepID=UPI001F051869|nr:hypothetical protein [Agrococcus sp. ARC_14]MCH1882044.1 hypothetical protein [Agrococcus sp. ARC_14]